MAIQRVLINFPNYVACRVHCDAIGDGAQEVSSDTQEAMVFLMTGKMKIRRLAHEGKPDETEVVAAPQPLLPPGKGRTVIWAAMEADTTLFSVWPKSSPALDQFPGLRDAFNEAASYVEFRAGTTHKRVNLDTMEVIGD